MEKKEKQAVWLYPRTKELIIKHMDEANARSQSEFIENAIKFYSGYLDCNSGTATEYLAHVLTSIIDGIVKGSEYRINRGLFKLAVESAMQSHFLAAVNDIDDEVKLTHTLKSIKTTIAMLEAQDSKYSGHYWDGRYYFDGETSMDGSSNRGSYEGGGSNRSYGRGRNANRDRMGRYAERGYSRADAEEDFRTE